MTLLFGLELRARPLGLNLSVGEFLALHLLLGPQGREIRFLAAQLLAQFVFESRIAGGGTRAAE